MSKATEQLEEIILTICDFHDLTFEVKTVCMCGCTEATFDVHLN